MRIRIFILVLFLVSLGSASAQAQWNLGLEVQGYPTGMISAVQLEYVTAKCHAFHMRAGYNMVRHRDQGVSDDERGGGPGFSLGYRHVYGPKSNQWHLGVRNDLWFNKINWEDLHADGVLHSGTTRIVVLQPTVEAACRLPIPGTEFYYSPSIAFGFEVNVVTNGKEVGQGPILLLGLTVGKHLGDSTSK
ncbi:MAG: hypothetical protein R2792_07345 [Saprospiraceae bacterium]